MATMVGITKLCEQMTPNLSCLTHWNICCFFMIHEHYRLAQFLISISIIFQRLKVMNMLSSFIGTIIEFWSQRTKRVGRKGISMISFWNWHTSLLIFHWLGLVLLNLNFKDKIDKLRHTVKFWDRALIWSIIC